MFRKTPEQQIVEEADKIASMKESLDALSWSRVADISKVLQESPSEKERYELARELMSIAQANTSLIHKLGLTNTTFTGQLMASGIESLSDVKDPALAPAPIPAPSYSLKKQLDQQQNPLPNKENEEASSLKVSDSSTDEVVQTEESNDGLSSIFASLEKSAPYIKLVEESSAKEKQSVLQEPVLSELSDSVLSEKESQKDISDMISRLMREDAFDISEIDDIDLALIDTVLEEIASVDINSLVQSNSQNQNRADEALELEKVVSSDSATEKKSKEYIRLPDPVMQEEQAVAAQQIEVLAPHEEKQEFRQLEVALEGGQTPPRSGRKPRWFKKQDLARFKRIYTSRDDALYIYEDSMGHIVAIDSSKLI